MHIVPRILMHGFGVQTPGGHLAESEGNYILETQCDHKGRMAQRFDLVDLKRQPEHQRCDLDHKACRNQEGRGCARP